MIPMRTLLLALLGLHAILQVSGIETKQPDRDVNKDLVSGYPTPSKKSLPPTRYPTPSNKYPPTRRPTGKSSSYPTPDRTSRPPTRYPTRFPTKVPPTRYPTKVATKRPTPAKTKFPTPFPHKAGVPTRYPTRFPTATPTSKVIAGKTPTAAPTPVISCRLPNYLGRGLVGDSTNPCAVGTTLANGGSCAVMCDTAGYASNDGSQEFSCNAGRLTRPSLTCTPKDCLIPAFGAHVEGAATQTCVAGQYLGHGSYCRVKCEAGYRPSRGSSAYSCYAGDIRQATFTCSAGSAQNQCQLPATFGSGITGSSAGGCEEGSVLPQGSTCEVGCMAGWYARSSRVTTNYTCSNGASLRSPTISCRECTIDEPELKLKLYGEVNRTVYSFMRVSVYAHAIVKACRNSRKYTWFQTSGPQVTLRYPNSRRLYIGARTLAPGDKACFTLEAVAKGMQKGIGAWTDTKSVSTCITVIGRPLRAKINGGYFRKWTSSEALELDGSKSYDPELPYKQRYTGMEYFWDCSVVGQPNSRCFDENSEPASYNSAKFVVPANSLNASTDYQFSLRVTSGNRERVTRVRVRATLDPMIDVEVNLLSKNRESDNGEFTVDSTSKVNIYAAMGPADRKKMSGYSFSWACTGISVSSSTPTLVIPAGTLTATTTCTLDVTGANGIRTGTSSIVLEANAPPAGGTCAPTVGNGTVLDINHFSFQCQGWTDTSDPPVWYRYSIMKYDTDSSSWIEATPLSKFSESSDFIPASLPAGDASNNYKHKIRAFMRDSAFPIQAASSVDFDVTVEPASTSALAASGGIESVALDLIDSEMSDGGDEVDLEKTLQIAKTVASVLDSEVTSGVSANALAIIRDRNTEIKKEMYTKSQSAIDSADTEEDVLQAASFLTTIASKAEEVSADVSASVLNSTASLLKNIDENELEISKELAVDLLSVATVSLKASSLAEASTSGGTASPTSAPTIASIVHRKEMAGTFNNILKSISKSVAKSLAPGEDSTIETDDVKVTTTKNYAGLLRTQSSSFGESGSGAAKFDVDPGVFSTGDLQNASTLETRFVRLKSNIYDYAKEDDEVDGEGSELVEFEISVDGESKKVNGTAPITITIPAPTSASGQSLERKCSYFDEENDRWSESGCTVQSTTLTETTCVCTHLTTFRSRSYSQNSGGGTASEQAAAAGLNVLAIAVPVAVVSVAVGFYMYCRNKMQRKTAPDTELEDEVSEVSEAPVEDLPPGQVSVGSDPDSVGDEYNSESGTNIAWYKW